MARRHSAVEDRADPLAEHDEALAARDPSLAAAAFSEDGVLDFKAFDDPGSGREQVEARYRYLFEAFPDLHTQRIRRFLRPEEVVEELLLLGTHRGPFLGVPGTGRAISVRARFVFRLKDRAIIRLDAYVDLPTLLMQIGAPQSSRYADAGALAASNLTVDLAESPVDYVGAVPTPPAPPPPPPAPVAPAPAPARAGRHTGGWLLVALLVLAGAGVAAWLHYGRATSGNHPGATTASSPAPTPSASSGAPSPAAAAAPVAVNGVSLLTASPRQIAGFAGRPVTVVRARVLLVSAHDGIWIGEPGHAFWVELADEVPYNPNLPFKDGQVVSFVGTLVPNTRAFAADVHVDHFVDATLVLKQGYHINADYTRIAIG